MVALAEISCAEGKVKRLCGRRARCVKNCGYRYDAETDNYYVRNRYYSPILGRWLTRDPIGYQGGINLYGYVDSSPVGMVDPEGNSAAVPSLQSLTLGIDLGVLQGELAYFKASGYTMAAALLQGFLGNRYGKNYPGGSTNAFNTPAFQNEVKGSKDYRFHARMYFGSYVRGLVEKNRSAFPNGKTVNVPIPKSAPHVPYNIYIRFYFDTGYGDSSTLANDLMYAFGGLAFNFRGSISVTRCHKSVSWSTKGLYVMTNDDYTFPNYAKNASWTNPSSYVDVVKEFAAEMSTAFLAGYSLQHQFHYKPFAHTLDWSDSFSGKFSLSQSLPSHWGDGSWVMP
jgi:RHS repeat-associated protein